MLTRRTLLAAGAAAPLTAMLPRLARSGEPEVFSIGGLAIRGADPVAYFTESSPVSGDSAHELMWRGTTWRFASTANLELFMADPERYAPQYGGYCAFALSKGYIATSVPEAWTIYDGKLYLNYSLNVRQLWSGDIPGNIALADGNWPAILG